MGLVALVALFVALILIGVGIAIGLVACFLAAILLGMGVVSSSFIIGLRSGRSADGVRAFFLQCGVLAGIPAGALCAWLAHSFVEELQGVWPVVAFGAIGGALAGVLLALMLDSLSRRLHRWALARIKPTAHVVAPAIDQAAGSGEQSL